MKTSILTFIAFLAICSLQAQNSKVKNKQLDGLANSIRTVAKSNLSETEQNERIKGILHDFSASNPNGVLNPDVKTANMKLAELKKEKPLPEAKVKEFLRMQKESYDLVGIGNKSGKVAQKSRGLGDSSVTNLGTAFNLYSTFAFSGGLGNNAAFALPGYLYISPIGSSIYNDFMMTNVVPYCSNCVVLLPLEFNYQYTSFQSLEPIPIPGL